MILRLFGSPKGSWCAIEQPSLRALCLCGDVCETRYGGPIRFLLRQGSADAWPTRFGGNWATGHLALAHSTSTLGLLPGSAATLLQNWSGGDVRETSYGGPIRFLLRQGSADAWPTRSAVSGPQVTWPWRTPPNWFWPAEFMFCLLDDRSHINSSSFCVFAGSQFASFLQGFCSWLRSYYSWFEAIVFMFHP